MIECVGEKEQWTGEEVVATVVLKWLHWWVGGGGSWEGVFIVPSAALKSASNANQCARMYADARASAHAHA